MTRIFIKKSAIKEGVLTLRGKEFRYLGQVLRLREGDNLTLIDEDGLEYQGKIRQAGKKEIILELSEGEKAENHEQESALFITVGQGIPKSDKMDTIIRGAIELGASRIYPFFSLYTVPKYDRERAEKRVIHWRGIAQDSARVSRRRYVPEIGEIRNFPDLLKGAEKDCLKVILWEGERERSLKELLDTERCQEKIFFLIGSEGGFAPEEVESAKEAGFLTCTLGKRIVRTERAALVVLSIIQFLWGDLG